MTQRELHGWKEIADYLNRSVRTAQRWERELALPVRRLPTASSEVVYAIADEIEAWKVQVGRRNGADSDFRGVEPEEGVIEDAASLDGAPAVDLELPARTVIDTEPRRLSRWQVAGGVLFSLLLLASALWFARHAEVRPSVTAEDEAAQDAVLDPGPWPTTAHDMRRTNRSHLAGPAKPTRVRKLLSLPLASPYQISTPVVTADGHLIVGHCGQVTSYTPDGRPLWHRETKSVSGLLTQASGFAVNNQGNSFFTAVPCEDPVDSIQSYLYAVAADGTPIRELSIGTSFAAPAFGPTREIYTLDEINFLRSFHASYHPRWGTTLAGFLSGGIAVDARGNVYVGTDGGQYHQPSLWSIGSNGEVRWSALRDDLGLPAVWRDRVYVASLQGVLHAFSLEGQELWQRSLGPLASVQPLALGADGSIYVRTVSDVVAVKPNGDLHSRVPAGPSAYTSRASPVVDRDGHIYVTASDAVFSVNAKGEERWRTPLPKPAGLVIGGPGLLYATTTTNEVYEIRER